MKRRLVLLGGTLGAIVLLYLIYLAVTGVGGGKHRALPPEPVAVEASRAAPSPGAVEPEEGTDFRTTDRDEQGRLRRVFSAPAYKRTGEGVYVLTRPRAVIYQDDGQQIQITADEGTIHTKVLRSDAGPARLSVKRGQLEGNVKLYLDRSPPAVGPPVEERTDDPNVLEVSADNIHFDSDKLLLYTNDRVRVMSQQVEMSGRGLSIQWDEDPQELQILRMEHGDQLVVRYVPGEDQDIGLVALPGGGPRGAASAEAPELATVAPAEEPPATSMAASEPAGATRPAPARRQGKNIYAATFYGDVQVVQGARYIRGTDTLTMEFQWARERLDRAEPPRAAVTTGDLVAPAGTAGATAPDTLARTPDRPASSAPAAPAMGEPITITWTGPLEIVPTGYTDKPSRKNVAIVGRGAAATLFDGQASAVCREFEFRRKDTPTGDRRMGRLSGSHDCPAMLSLAGGEQIVCPTMRFELSAAGDTARLEGEGYMTRPAGRESGSELALLPSRPSAERAPSNEPTGEGESASGSDVEYISWLDSVDTVLARGETAQDRVYVRQARFRGEVELSGGDSGNRMSCDELLVTIDRRGPEGASRARTEITAVQAQGHVVVSGGSDRGRWQAFADRLDADPPEGTAVLHGEPARLTGRDSTLSGRTVDFQTFKDADGAFIRGAGQARVQGQGQLEMLMDKDLSGADLSTPRPGTITWQREMRYVDYGRSGLGPREGPDIAPATATFLGQVHLVSGDEEITCGQMRATFAEPAAQASSRARPGELNLGAVNYGGPLWKVFASQQVVLISHRRDELRRMRGLAELRTDSMVYDAVAKTVDAQAGWLLVQDLRPPQEKTTPPARTDSGAAPLAGQNLDSPSQTYFEWYKTMHVGMAARVVELTGDVWMRHVAGDKIVDRDVVREKWDIQDWPDPLPSGRMTDLRCDNLLAQFASPSSPAEPSAVGPAPANDLQPGLNLVGPLDLFVATGSVLLRDDPWEVVGQKLTYARKPDLVTVLGSADGGTQANARISRTERDRVITNESPWVRWYRATDRIETGPMTGSGLITPSGGARR